MSLKKILLVAVASFVVYGGFALPCQAQGFNRHRSLRWLGQGYSDGYHRHNPGHDTSYYNPYTAHNSNLVSRSPEYQAILAQQAYQQPAKRFFSGVPFSVYAAPDQITQGFHNLPGQQVEGTFSPSTGSGLRDSKKDEASDNSVEPSYNDDDDDFRDDEDNDFRDDEDNDFRDDLTDEKESMEDMDFQEPGDVEDADVDTSDLGGLSGLNDSLSFDFD